MRSEFFVNRVVTQASLLFCVWRGSTIGEGGNTKISSPGRSSNSPFRGSDYMIPYMVGKLAPNSSHLNKGLVSYVPGRGYFRAVPSQNGDKYVTSPSPPIVELVFVRYPCTAINDIVQYTPTFFLFTQAPILVWFDSTIIDISTILVTMYYSRYVGLRLVAVHGD